MATSGSYSFTLNKRELLYRTLQSINAVDISATPDNADYQRASDMLNMMLKMWEVDGIHLFKRYRGTLFTQLNQGSYQLGSVSGADHVCRTEDYSQTTISSTEALGQTTLSITSSSGMTAGDFIGIELDDLTRQWTTISSVPNSTSVIVNNALTAQASAGNTVVSYTTKLNRPLGVLLANVMDLKSNNTENNMTRLSFDDYFNLPVKNTQGKPDQYFYDRITSNAIPYTGTLYLYPGKPQNTYQIINFVYADSLQDMLNSEDNFDLPQEWMLPIMSNLAVLLATFGYGKQVEFPNLKLLADEHYAILKASDSDMESLSISLKGDHE